MSQTPALVEGSAVGREALESLAAEALEHAKELGASAAEVALGTSDGLSVTARLGEVETVERTRDKDLSVTVYFGSRSGSASTSDFRAGAVRDTVRAACTIARYTAADPCSGLADPDRLARSIPDLDLYHEWELGPEDAVDLAVRTEDAARADKRIVNSEGATVTSHRGLSVYGNSLGFLGSVRGTRHSISCAVVAGQDGGMQRDYWYTVARDPRGLDDAASVGRIAAERAVRRLGGRKISTRQCDVIFEAQVAASLWSHWVSATRGPSLYRGASFLVDSLGKQVFADHISIRELPLLPGRLASAAFDSEGVATADRTVVDGGRIAGYFLDSYSARKLGLASTASSGGVHNLTITPTAGSLEDLLRDMGRGLLVTELIGFGVNTVTGDYSRGAAGFLVEDGRIAGPVEEITVAGNLKDMFRNIRAVGSDVDYRGSIVTGSVWVPGLTVAGG